MVTTWIDCRDYGNDFNHYSFSFLEVESQTTEEWKFFMSFLEYPAEFFLRLD